MLEPGTGPVFLMAYSFADVFRVYKNILKLVCLWMDGLGVWVVDTQPLH